MPKPSISHWRWMRDSNTRVEGGLFVCDDASEDWYCPGEHTEEILSALIAVTNEQSALKFVKDWGTLGLSRDVARIEEKSARYFGAINYALYNAEVNKSSPESAWDDVYASVNKYFDIEDGYINKNRESVADTIHFARQIWGLSKVKKLLDLYQEDPIAAEYDTERWVNSISHEWKEMFVVGLDFLKDDYRLRQETIKDYNKSFYLYLLDILLSAARSRFSHRSRRGVWIQFYTSSIEGQPGGFPIIQFDALFRFIEYSLLVEGGPSPKHCANPKCGRLFFPTKSDRIYCPPPPGVKRSRCENAHGQQLRRKGEGKKRKGGNPKKNKDGAKGGI